MNPENCQLRTNFKEKGINPLSDNSILLQGLIRKYWYTRIGFYKRLIIRPILKGPQHIYMQNLPN